MEKLSLSAQIILWVMGCSAGIWVVVYLCMSYYNLPLFPLAAAGISLMTLLVVSWAIVNRHLKPLARLAGAAERVAEGHIDEQPVLGSGPDEIGQLEGSFKQMQQALSEYIADLQQKRELLSRQNASLQEAYQKTREADSVKERFLSNMTDQMVDSVGTITKLNDTICKGYNGISRPDMVKIQIQMLNETETITRLLDQMLSASQRGQQPPTPTEPIMP